MDQHIIHSNNSSSENFDTSSLLPILSEQTMPFDHINNIFQVFDAHSEDINHSNIPADGPHGFDGSDQTQFEEFYKNHFDEIDFSALLPRVKENSTKSFVVKSSENKHLLNFINPFEMMYTTDLLRIIIPPFTYQRARYENELDDILRYIFVPNNQLLTLKIFDRPDNIARGMSAFVRITRLMIPYGSENLILCHPYSIWLNDKDAKVYNGSLFLPITNDIIEIERLILQRSKQEILGRIEQFSIFKSNQLDFNDFHQINTNKPKDLIKQYQLQYSILHFQIVFVDQNNRLYLTDLQCQTEPMHEYEGNKLKNFPPNIRNLMGQSIKRKRIGEQKESSMNINKKKEPSLLNGLESVK